MQIFSKPFHAYTKRLAIATILAVSFHPLSSEGTGTLTLVPISDPESLMRITLFATNFGTFGFWYCLQPTTSAFCFYPLMASRMVSPIVATFFLQYSPMQVGYLLYGYPSSLSSTTLTLISLMIWNNTGVVVIRCGKPCMWGTITYTVSHSK